MSDTRPIGVFDSGIGGLTVLREIRDLMPGESTVYFGDNGRTPYGTKSRDTVRKYSLQNMKFLLEQNVKMIVIACNTASAYAYEDLKKHSPVPVVEVVTPGAREAVQATHNGSVGIIATSASVSSGVYKEAILEAASAASVDVSIVQKACPLFVSLAEEGWWDNEITRLTAREYLKSIKDASVDTLVLGCTHYPLLSKVIGEEMGPSVRLVNTGKAVARVVQAYLTESGLCNTDGEVTRSFYTSDDPGMFEAVASPFLGSGLPSGTVHFSTDRYDVEDLL